MLIFTLIVSPPPSLYHCCFRPLSLQMSLKPTGFTPTVIRSLSSFFSLLSFSQASGQLYPASTGIVCFSLGSISLGPLERTRGGYQDDILEKAKIVASAHRKHNFLTSGPSIMIFSKIWNAESIVRLL